MPPKTHIDIPGAIRTDFPDGSYLIEAPNGEKYLVSDSGEINANLPELKKVGVADLSQVLRHEVVTVHDTTSHTLHLVGGGVFSYLHHRNGNAMSIHANCVSWCTPDPGVLLVRGTTV